MTEKIDPIIKNLNTLSTMKIIESAKPDQIKTISKDLDALEKAKIIKEWEIHSLKLFLDPVFTSKVKVFSIRFHQAIKRAHFDYCIGSYDERLAIDFIIPGALNSNDIAMNDNLPRSNNQEKTLIFVGAHKADPFLIQAVGYGKLIEKGYGAGKWRIVKQGNKASLVKIEDADDTIKPKKKDKWRLVLGVDRYIITKKFIERDFKNEFLITKEV